MGFFQDGEMDNLKGVDEMPTPPQRVGLCKMLGTALIEIRGLIWTGKPEQAAELASAFHNLPNFLGTDFRKWDRNWFHGQLNGYQEVYGNSPDFVAELNRLFPSTDCKPE